MDSTGKLSITIGVVFLIAAFLYAIFGTVVGLAWLIAVILVFCVLTVTG